MMFSVIRRHLEAVVHDLDPARVAPKDAVALLAEADRIVRLGTAAKTLLAPRAAESGQWARDGHVTPEQWLAILMGTTVRSARDTLETGERVTEQPKVEEALRKGDLSAEQATLVSDAAKDDPAAAEKLLNTAAHDSLAALRDEAERTKAAASKEDAEERRKRIHRARCFFTRKNRDGSSTATLQGTPESIARFKAHAEPFIRDAFEAARREGRRESADAYAFDGVMAMAAAASGAASGGTSDPAKARGRADAQGDGKAKPKVPAKIIVRVDYGALWRGYLEPGEICEIAGAGPVPLSVVDEMMADAFLAAVITKGKDVATVAHLGRAASAYQRTALQFRDRHCIIEGCTNPRVEIDHHEDWARTHQTWLPELGGLCKRHHRLKTLGLTLGDATLPGRKRLIPPTAGTSDQGKRSRGRTGDLRLDGARAPVRC